MAGVSRLHMGSLSSLQSHCGKMSLNLNWSHFSEMTIPVYHDFDHHWTGTMNARYQLKKSPRKPENLRKCAVETCLLPDWAGIFLPVSLHHFLTTVTKPCWVPGMAISVRGFLATPPSSHPARKASRQPRRECLREELASWTNRIPPKAGVCWKQMRPGQLFLVTASPQHNVLSKKTTGGNGAHLWFLN